MPAGWFSVSRPVSPLARASLTIRMRGSHLISVEVSHLEDTDVVSPVGDIDIATAPEVRRLMLASPGGRRIVLDLRGVTFMDTSGLLLLVEGRRRALAEGGEFAIVDGPPAVRRVIEVAGLDLKIEHVGAPQDEVPHAV
jgi:anti-sigma B factor antagonist